MPHITIILPVNVSVERVPEVLASFARPRPATEPMSVRLGPPTTFEPVSPVVYLGVHTENGPVHGGAPLLDRAARSPRRP